MRTWKTLEWLSLMMSLVIYSCTTFQTLTNTVRPSPRERYALGLEKSELKTSSMVQSWIKAGDLLLHDSMLVSLPYQETGYFAMSEPQARCYRFDVKDGQILTLTTMVKSKTNAKLFIDLFTKEEGKWKQVAYADSLTFSHEFEKSGSCLVRIQPELLVNMFYSITLSVTPVLLNPVKGASNKSIGSFYGDPRDGGKRKHEGIDIFAPKGTFVVAPTDGVVTRVGTSALGGKTVWMNDVKRNHSYYFAHLDSQMVRIGVKVKQGDILGTVGNTGNARTTPSHLHFGVFQNSYKDPIAYIRTMEKLVNELAPDTLFQSIVFRVNQNNAALQSGPTTKFPERERLSKDAYLKVIGQTKEWYRVLTANDTEGYIEKRKVTIAEKGNRIVVNKSIPLFSEASSDAVPVGSVKGTAEGLAVYKNFNFIRTTQGQLGWIDRTLL